MMCMVLPRRWPASLLVKCGLGATVLLTLGMALHVPALWPLLRFLAGVASAAVFVYTSEWCLRRLSSLGALPTGAVIYIGPGAGIAISGLVATAGVAANASATAAWLAFGLLAALLSGAAWPVFSGRGPASPSGGRAGAVRPVRGRLQRQRRRDGDVHGRVRPGRIRLHHHRHVSSGDRARNSAGFGMAGPVLANSSGSPPLRAACSRHGCPGRSTRASPSLHATSCRPSGSSWACSCRPWRALSPEACSWACLSRRSPSSPCRTCGACGPHQAARFMGLLTAVYGIGQIAGPALVGFLLARTATAPGLCPVARERHRRRCAAGAGLYIFMSWLGRFESPSSTWQPKAANTCGRLLQTARRAQQTSYCRDGQSPCLCNPGHVRQMKGH